MIMNKKVIVVILAVIFIINCTRSELSKKEAVNIAKTTREVQDFLEKFPHANVDADFTNVHKCSDPYPKSWCKTEYFWEVVFYKEDSRPISSALGEDDPIEVWIGNDGEILSVCQMACVMRSVSNN